MRRAGALAVALLALAACRAPAAPVPPAPATASTSPTAAVGTLRVAISEPDDAQPHKADTTAEQWIADTLYDGLTTWDAGLRPVPAAAISWRDEGLRLWRFRLRPGAAWHDGAPVTADDVLRGWNALVRDGVMAHLLSDVAGYDEVRAGETAELAGLRAPAPDVVEVELTRPFADFPVVVGHPALAPLPADHALPRSTRKPIGNGPFMAAEERVPGRFLRLRRDSAWRNGPVPSLDEIVFQTMDAETAFLAFQQGRIHVAEVPPGALTAALERYGDAIRTAVRPALYLLGMNVARPPYDAVAVRRALGQAVDRTALAAGVREGSTAPQDGLLVEGLPEWTAEHCAACAYDPLAARTAFAAAGVSTLTLAFNEGGGHDQVAERLRRDLADAGVELMLAPMAPDDYLRAVRAGALGLFRAAWQADAPTADLLLRPLLHGASVPRGPDDVDSLRRNDGRYRSARVDALLDEAAATTSPVVRAARYREAARQAVFFDHAVVPLFAYRLRVAVRPEVDGLRADGFGRLSWVTAAVAPAGARPERS